MKQVLDFLKQHQLTALTDLKELLRFKSVSTDPIFSEDVTQCAYFLEATLKKMGMQKTTVFSTKGHPIVYSEYIVSKDYPTILCYGHYDVQPADPYELWDSDPFDPKERLGYLYARGVSDDKGQFMCHIKAIEAFLTVHKTLPVNVKLLIEGEEEIGSKHLTHFIQEHKDLLSADVAVISDTPMISKSQPALCYSLRGLVYAELFVKGPNKDLHSGQYGGVLQNPIQVLATIISKLKDDQDRVLIPDFYKAVSAPNRLELDSLKQNILNKDTVLTDCGVKALVNETICIEKQLWLEPTLDCNGIVGGYIKTGAKTIIPSEASAKISMRLVANQDPISIQQSFSDYVNSLVPSGVTLDILFHNVAHPAKMDTNSMFMQAASQAYDVVFNQKPVLVGEGGTIPVVSDFKKMLNLDTVMMGFNCPDDCIHSPNERLWIDSFYKGIQTMAYFFDLVGKSKNRSFV